MSNRSYNPLPLYYDPECRLPVAYSVEGGQVIYENMAFTRLDGGSEATSDFYIRNTSMGPIEDLIIKVESVNRSDVTVQLASRSPIKELASRQVYHGRLKWTSRVGGKAGKCLARIVVSGMLTQEM